MVTYKSMAEVRQANKAAGYFWFSTDTVRFFGSKVETGLIDGRYWVESTRNYDDSGREYKVAQVADNGDISHVHGPNYESKVFGSKRDALFFLEGLRAAHAEKEG